MTPLIEDFDFHNDYSRIVGGFAAPIAVPWFVRLKIKTKNGTLPGYDCGATLITSRLQ